MTTVGSVGDVIGYRPEPCTRSANTMMVGAACAACGHYGGLHPGVPNTALRACLACVVDVLTTLLVDHLDLSTSPPSSAHQPLDLSGGTS